MLLPHGALHGPVGGVRWGMAEYVRSILIHAPIAKVYDFHLYTPNARHIQPVGFKVEHVAMPETVEVGAEVLLRMRVYGLRQVWRVVWDALEPPSGEPARALLVDRALSSPFPSFVHRHELAAEGEASTRLTDRITYTPPWWALGRPGRWLVAAELDGLFRGRQASTKRILEASELPTGHAPENADQAAALMRVRHAAGRSRNEPDAAA